MSTPPPPVPTPGTFDPTLFMTFFSICPWWTISRHFAAFIFYIVAIAQWPTNTYKKYSVNGKYTLSTGTFILVFWCACFFHYMISAGRVQVDWYNGRFKARGWLVQNSRRTHRVILAIALATSAATVIQTSTVHTVLAMEREQADNDGLVYDATAISLLKADFILCLMLAMYAGVRLSLEPTGLIKRRREHGSSNRRRLPSNETDEVTGSGGDQHSQNGNSTDDEKISKKETSSKVSIPEFVEECQICVQRVANRQLNCGHMICCCCVMDIIRYSDCPLTALTCPFCRQPITFARQLQLTVCEKPISLTKCCSNAEPII